MKIKIIYGPPGTGKTTKLLSLVENRLKKYDPDKIAYVSFTRKGSYEGRDRALQKFNFGKEDFPYFKTLHSLAYTKLGINKSQVISKYHYRKFSEALGLKFTGYYSEEFTHTDDRYLFFDMLQRNNPRTASNYLYVLDMPKLRYVQKNYKRFREELGILDFTDMIEKAVEQKIKIPVDIVIIDEAQDLTTLQWKFIWTAFGHCKEIIIAGDDDQAVYEWSGADIKQLLHIRGEQTILDQSFRVPKKILQYSQSISAMIKTRVPKKYKPVADEGTVNFISSIDELNIDSFQSWLFLSRNNLFLKKIEKQLQDKGVVYEFKGEVSYKPVIFKAIRAYEDIRTKKIAKENSYLFTQYTSIPLNKIAFDKAWYEVFDKLPDSTVAYYRHLIAHNTVLDIKTNIKLETIHSSKGGEADNVVLVMDYTTQISKNFDANPDSEYRCYYVAVTRAKKNLFLLDPERKNHYPYIYV